MSQNQSPIMDPLHHDNIGFQMPNMVAPPLMNPPPQLFGAYNTDGLPLAVDLSDMSFGDGSLLDDSNEAKRRRIARVGYIGVKECMNDGLTMIW